MTANETARERAICGPCLTLGSDQPLQPHDEPWTGARAQRCERGGGGVGAAFDMVRAAFLAGKCPEYSVH